MIRFHRLFFLGAMTLFLLAGAAWGQSRTPASPTPSRQLPSGQEDIKPSPGDQQDLLLKDSREKPLQAQEDQVGKSLKKQQPIKSKSRVSRDKKSDAGKPASGAQQDPFALREKSNWWPSKPQPAPSSFSSLELSPRQDPEKDSTPEDDEAEDKSEEKAEETREQFENLPRGLKKMIKSQIRTRDTELDED